MKSTPIIFITLNSIDKYLSHASQMHIHTYKWRVHDSEPYSGIQGRHKCLWTLVDPCGPWHVYAPCGHISLLFFMFFLSYSFPKRLYHPLHHRQSHNRLSPSSQHHVWLHPSYILLFSQHSPVICKDFFPLVHMYKSSRYYTVLHIDLGPMFPQSTSL